MGWKGFNCFPATPAAGAGAPGHTREKGFLSQFAVFRRKGISSRLLMNIANSEGWRR